MTRTQIRYALFRCKAKTQDEAQQLILDSYKDQLDEYGFSIDDFTNEWDIDKKELSQIVTGKIVKKYNQFNSLFSGDGQLKN